jgi:mannose-6-phosphate isomerase-like protein (cupin superfamily)
MAKTMAPKVNTHNVALDTLGDFGADRALMVHREGTGEAELHEIESDVIVVISGSGTLIVGGTMPGSKTTAPGEVRAPSVDGGDRQKIAQGDILHIPPKIPHQVALEPGTQITYFTLKVKE